MAVKEPLKIENLEERISRAVGAIVSQFREYPHIVPEDKVTLYRAESSVLEEFRDKLVTELQDKGYEVPVVISDRSNGYSIDVNEMLFKS